MARDDNGIPEKKGPGLIQAALVVGPTYILITMSLAQFINTYDTTAMNVAISSIVSDLHTTVTGVQSALTLYALIMAACMITGGKLGDIWGKKKMLTIGVALYGLGAIITAFSVNLAMMIVGWSVLEGVGSALMIPAIYALIPTVFKDPSERTKAFATIGSVAGAGAAMGPLLCGIISTYLTWRVSFAAEAVIVIIVLLLLRRIKAPTKTEREKLDLVGAALSALGLGLLVLGILQANKLATKGYLPVVVLAGLGLVFIGAFLAWEVRQKRRGAPGLMDPVVLRVREVKVGLPLTAIQSFMMSGALFVIPVFEQMALGYSPVMTGLTFLPNTFAMVIVSQFTGRLAAKHGRKPFIITGLGFMSVAIFMVAITASSHAHFWVFLPWTLMMGTGLGLVMGPLTDVVQSSVAPARQSEMSGVNRSIYNLGASLGTAIAGAVLMVVLISGLTGLINQSTRLTAQEKKAATTAVSHGAQTMSDSQMKQVLESRNVTGPIEETLVEINAQARDKALRVALGVVGVVGMLGFAIAFLLPKT